MNHVRVDCMSVDALTRGTPSRRSKPLGLTAANGITQVAVREGNQMALLSARAAHHQYERDYQQYDFQSVGKTSITQFGESQTHASDRA